MPLCNLCQGFADSLGRAYVEDHYRHQPSFQSLRTSSKTCELCLLIIKCFEDTGQTESILHEAEKGYPTVICFVGVNRNGAWKYYLQYQSLDTWQGLVGLMVLCGDETRNDD